MGRLLRIAAILLLLAILGGLATVSSETGLRGAIGMAARLLPGRLMIGDVHGNLLSGFHANNIRYQDASTEVRLDSLVLAWHPSALLVGELDIENLNLDNLTFTELGSQGGDQPLILPSVHLPVRVKLRQLTLNHLEFAATGAAPRQLIARAELSADVDESGAHIRRLHVERPEFQAEIAGDVALNQNYPLQLQLDWRANVPERGELQGRGRLSGDLKNLIFQQKLGGLVAGDMEGQVNKPLENPKWQAKGMFPSQSIRPLWSQAPDLQLKLDVEGSGTLAEQSFAVSFVASDPSAGAFSGRMRLARQRDNTLMVQNCVIEHPQSAATVSFKGELADWEQTLRFDLQGQWQKLSWPLTGKANWQSASGRFKASGTPDKIAAELNAQVLGHGLRAETRIKPTGDGFVIEALQVSSPGTQAHATGQWGKAIDLSWSLTSSAPGEWLPGAKGSLSSKGALRGTPTAPLLSAELQGSRLAYGGFGAGTLNLKLDAGLQPNDRLECKLDAASLRLGDSHGSLALSSRGTAADHQVSAKLNLGGQHMNVSLQGRLAESRWRGLIQQMDLDILSLGAWRLGNHPAFSVSRELAEISSSCWQQNEATFCGLGQWSNGGDWQAQFDLKQLPMQRLRALAPQWPEWRASVNLSADVRGHGVQLQQAMAELQTSSGELVPGENLASLPKLKLDPAHIKLRFVGHELSAAVELKETGVDLRLLSGQINVHEIVHLERLADYPASGQLAVHLPNLARFVPESKEVANIKGDLNGDINLKGSLSQPRVTGLAALRPLSFDLPTLGIAIEQGELLATADSPDAITVTGKLRSEQKELKLAGVLHPWQQDTPGELHIEGRNFPIVRIPVAQVFVSPNLSLTYSDQAIRLDGTVEVPEARIEPAKQQSVVTASEDVVIVSKKAKAAPPVGPSIPIESRIRLILGKAVHVEGHGFKGLVRGQLAIEDLPTSGTRASGELKVKDGTYAYYGAELKLDYGYARYANTPIANPNLDVQATRKIEEVTAGVRITGTAEKPNIALFSEPTLAQRDILSYILTGTPTSQLNESNSNTVSNAATSLGLKGGNLIGKEIIDRVGILSDIKFESKTGEVEQTALMLGKYLTPRLYVQYGLGLLSPINILRIRYKLSKHWDLQSETGPYSSGDVLFNLER